MSENLVPAHTILFIGERGVQVADTAWLNFRLAVNEKTVREFEIGVCSGCPLYNSNDFVSCTGPTVERSAQVGDGRLGINMEEDYEFDKIIAQALCTIAEAHFNWSHSLQDPL